MTKNKADVKAIFPKAEGEAFWEKLNDHEERLKHIEKYMFEPCKKGFTTDLQELFNKYTLEATAALKNLRENGKLEFKEQAQDAPECKFTVGDICQLKNNELVIIKEIDLESITYSIIGHRLIMGFFNKTIRLGERYAWTKDGLFYDKNGRSSFDIMRIIE